MRKMIALIVLLIAAVINCTSFRESWERVESQRKERGYGCYVDQYSGNTHCGYRR